MSTSGIDFTRADFARIYDVLAGGRDNFAADGDLAGRLLEVCPSLRNVVQENRAFIARAVTWAAQEGIGQFADVGTGTSVRPCAGDAARAVIPGARIACIDHDPIVIAIARALLADDEGTAAAAADLTDPAAVLAHADARAVIDPAEPVCVVLGLALSLMPARQAVAGYADLIAPGSYVVISCGRSDDEELRKQFSEAFTAADSYKPLAGRGERVPRRPGARPARARRGAELAWRLARAGDPAGGGVRAGRGREEEVTARVGSVFDVPAALTSTGTARA